MHDALLALAEKGRINETDVAHLRSDVFPQGVESYADAEMLFAIDLASHSVCEEWSEFLSDALATFLVGSGEVSMQAANWLIRCTSRLGVVDSVQRCQLIFAVIGKAHTVPSKLRTLLIRQVHLAVASSKGPLGENRAAAKGEITWREFEMLTKAVNGAHRNPEKDEIAALYELDKDIARSEENWSRFYLDCVGSYVLGKPVGNASQTAPYRLSEAAEKPFRLEQAEIESIGDWEPASNEEKALVASLIPHIPAKHRSFSLAASA